MTKYQIRDGTFGLAVYEAETPRDALYAFFADREKGKLRPLIEDRPDGTAALDYEGVPYSAVPLAAPAAAAG